MTAVGVDRQAGSGGNSLPRGVWPLTLVFTLGLISLLFEHLVADTPRSGAFDMYNAPRLDRLAANMETGATGIVLIGDSRLRYAVAAEKDFSKLLSDRLGVPVSVVRMTNNWAIWDDFSGLAPRILEIGPQLVVLQEDLFAKERETQSRLFLGRAYLIWQLTGHGPWNPGNLDQNSMQLEMRCEVLADEDVAARKKRVFRWVRIDPSGPNSRALNAFVAQAEAAGIGIAVLPVPITTSGDALPKHDRPPDHRTLDLSVEVPDEAYCDVVHMNAEGRGMFTEALAGPLIERIRGR